MHGASIKKVSVSLFANPSTLIRIYIGLRKVYIDFLDVSFHYQKFFYIEWQQNYVPIYFAIKKFSSLNGRFRFSTFFGEEKQFFMVRWKAFKYHNAFKFSKATKLEV